jgi:small subunit ribosomal protein S4
MTKRYQQKYRICRQVGEDIWGSFFNINYKKKSGQHGRNRKKKKEITLIFNKKKKKKLSVSKYEFIYKIRKYYSNISKKQFDNICKKNKKIKINDKEVIYSKYIHYLLERRIDTVIYRINWASSFYNARQLINHGYVLLNGNPIKVSSNIINIGDIIEIKHEYKQRIKENILNNMNNIHINCPDYIEVNYNNLTAIFIYNPKNNLGLKKPLIPYATIKNIKQLKNIY